MRRFAAPVFLLFLASTFAPAASLPDLFLKAKQQFRLGSYSASLETLDRLAAESEEPGNEAYRAQLRPALAFYRGACLAALGRADEARTQFETFLTYQPGASLDPSAYPPQVLAAFRDAHREVPSERKKASAIGSMAEEYRAYVAPVQAASEESAADWADGPIHYLLTADQKSEYSRLSGPASRSEFISVFWKARDPQPETPENEARLEFERRVAYADSHFSQDEIRGSLTDRGMVFVLLGPPTWVGRRPLRTGDDRDDPLGMSRYSDLDIRNALIGKSPAASAAVYDHMTGPSTKLLGTEGNYEEVWHYRRELLPGGVSYQQVDFAFISRQGYGHNVLQREDRSIQTLEAARTAVRGGTFTRAAVPH
jgi:GWxTD domain-containing protein